MVRSDSSSSSSSSESSSSDNDSVGSRQQRTVQTRHRPSAACVEDVLVGLRSLRRSARSGPPWLVAALQHCECQVLTGMLEENQAALARMNSDASGNGPIGSPATQVASAGLQPVGKDPRKRSSKSVHAEPQAAGLQPPADTTAEPPTRGSGKRSRYHFTPGQEAAIRAEAKRAARLLQHPDYAKLAAKMGLDVEQVRRKARRLLQEEAAAGPASQPRKRNRVGTRRAFSAPGDGGAEEQQQQPALGLEQATQQQHQLQHNQSSRPQPRSAGRDHQAAQGMSTGVHASTQQHQGHALGQHQEQHQEQHQGQNRGLRQEQQPHGPLHHDPWQEIPPFGSHVRVSPRSRWFEEPQHLGQPRRQYQPPLQTSTSTARLQGGGRQSSQTLAPVQLLPLPPPPPLPLQHHSNQQQLSQPQPLAQRRQAPHSAARNPSGNATLGRGRQDNAGCELPALLPEGPAPGLEPHPGAISSLKHADAALQHKMKEVLRMVGSHRGTVEDIQEEVALEAPWAQEEPATLRKRIQRLLYGGHGFQSTNQHKSAKHRRMEYTLTA